MRTIVVPDALRIKISEDAAKEITSFIHKKAETLGSQTGKTPLNEKHRELLEMRLMKIAVGAMTRHDPERTPLVPFVKAMVNRSAFREAAREFNAQLGTEETPWENDSLDRSVTSDGSSANCRKPFCPAATHPNTAGHFGKPRCRVGTPPLPGCIRRSALQPIIP